MKVLYLSPLSYAPLMAKKGDAHYLKYWLFLIENTRGDKMVVWSGAEYNHDDIIAFNPSIVVCFHCNNVTDSHFSMEIIRQLRVLQIPIVNISDDVFYTINQDLSLVDAYIFKVKSTKLLDEFKKKFPCCMIKHMENMFIDTDSFHPWDEEKTHDVTIYGNMTCFFTKKQIPFSSTHEAYLIKTYGCIPDSLNFYDFRLRVKNLLISSGKYKINLIDSTENGGWDCSIKNEDLSRTIAKSYLSLSTRTGVDKCMMKYLEIAASDTVVLGDIPSDFTPLFKGSIVEINEDMTDDEILNVIDRALIDKKILVEKGMKLGQKIRKLYGTQSTLLIDEFHAKLNEVLYEYETRKRKITCYTIGNGLDGGLGNQLFNVAITLAIAKENNMLAYFKYSGSEQHNYSSLFKKLVFMTDEYPSRCISEGDDLCITDVDVNVCLNGYFQSAHYFHRHRDYLMKEMFYLSDAQLNLIEDTYNSLKDDRKTVGVHIRRTDYGNLGWILPKEYYHKALKLFPNHNVILFSDDIQWCLETFPEYKTCHLHHDYIELFVMAKMDSFVMANSTFSWWAVYIGGIKNVACPFPWFKNHEYNEFIYNAEWTFIYV